MTKIWKAFKAIKTPMTARQSLIYQCAHRIETNHHLRFAGTDNQWINKVDNILDALCREGVMSAEELAYYDDLDRPKFSRFWRAVRNHYEA